MSWYNAFVFDPEREEFQVYEVYLIDGSTLRTENPTLTLHGQGDGDIILYLEHLIDDLKRGRVFNSIDELDEKYGIKG